MRKTDAKVMKKVRADLAGASEEPGRVAAGQKVPNQREFTLNSPEAWELFRLEPSMLPTFPRHRHNPVERDH